MGHLMSPMNTERQQAEAMFSQLKANPNGLASMLVHVLRQSPHDDRRGMSAVMLRKASTAWQAVVTLQRCRPVRQPQPAKLPCKALH